MFVDLQIIMGKIYKFHELTACYGEWVNNLMQWKRLFLQEGPTLK